MKKFLTIVLVSALVLVQPVLAQSASDFQRKLYCKVSENSARVYLYQEKETLKCQYYLSVLNGYLKTEYQSLIQVMTNRNRGDDLAYWDGLFAEKKEQFLKLFAQKRLIQVAMQEFETELLTKSKLFLQASLLEKQAALEKAIASVEEDLQSTPSDFQLQRSLTQLKLKQDVIDALLLAETMDAFMKEFTSYLTLFPLPNE